MVLVGAAFTLPASSGCALAARAMTTAQVIEFASEVADRAATSSSSVSRAPAIATVAGTGGVGLKLNGAPGADRIDVFGDGTSVKVECRADGPHVDGPFGVTTAWLRVRVPDGREGFMSAAYLDRVTVVDVVQCGAPGGVG